MTLVVVEKVDEEVDGRIVVLVLLKLDDDLLESVDELISSLLRELLLELIQRKT